MKDTDIRKYAQLMGELGLTGLEIKDKDHTVRLERSFGTAPVQLVSAEPVAPSAAPVVGGDTVCSPMVGVFNRAPADNAAP